MNTPALDRRAALRELAALALALPAACSDSSSPSADLRAPDAAAAQTRWLELVSHLCLLYLPAAAIAARPDPRPLLIALHDAGESPPSSLDRWRGVADAAGLVVLCPNWTAEPVERQAELLDRLIRISEELDATTQPVDAARLYLAARGAATPYGYRGAFERHSGRWAGVSFLGGVPAGDWTGAPATALASLVEAPPAVHYTLGAEDPELDAARACASALAGRGVPVEQQLLPGTLASLRFDAASAWAWLSPRRAKNP
jgi:hypothetical protein